MTLTALIPSLRTSIPDPLDPDAWPGRTHASTTDVVVAGVSLTRLVEVCGTPCVHVGAAVVRGTGGCPSVLEQGTAVVVGVVAVTTGADGERRVLVDGRLDAVPAVLGELRLLGRASAACARPAIVTGPGEGVGDGVQAVLPRDLRPGDLLAFPCAGALPLRALR
ncbi:hypothetical protein [Rathayibacter sp. VKM Ac-2801]|uniref:hypothetical protein n=1 Tax=Rathayibacter sp. VKM Ac-2801 TaxID=2609255 RepID=UPI00131F6A20|nr:hypothetical protein [Rathayibacter sp. VKM Ac-2801]QHC69707.1 hypothetical protein GSU45_04475 [Rathayibacter sp. VKM Ac-2801]